MPITEAFPRNLRAARHAAQLSQSRLAAKANLSTIYITHLEHGRKLTTLRTLQRLADALGVHPADLLRAELAS